MTLLLALYFLGVFIMTVLVRYRLSVASETTTPVDALLTERLIIALGWPAILWRRSRQLHRSIISFHVIPRFEEDDHGRGFDRTDFPYPSEPREE